MTFIAKSHIFKTDIYFDNVLQANVFKFNLGKKIKSLKNK